VVGAVLGVVQPQTEAGTGQSVCTPRVITRRNAGLLPAECNAGDGALPTTAIRYIARTGQMSPVGLPDGVGVAKTTHNIADADTPPRRRPPERRSPVVVGTEQLRQGPTDHVVHFYEHDDDLTKAVGRYLGEAMAGHETSIVIATDAHRRAFEREMAAAGLDVADAAARGALVLLDASDTMSRFLIDERPDRRLFMEVVGGLIHRATSSGRGVRAYGEMVALLWDAGHVNAALELEDLWNELAGEERFSLLCAYPRASVGRSADADAFAHVCRLHSAVLPSRFEVQRAFPRKPTAPGMARRLVIRSLRQWQLEDLIDDAILVTTELATNAVRHAGCGFTLTVSAQGDVVRICVLDDSRADLPQPRIAGSLSSSGRGLHIIDAIAVRWGTDVMDGGKSVWAELRR
jgi:anti-sigma regulatory factor (Ser/Thr protein kinase)